MESIKDVLTKDKPKWYIPEEQRMTYAELMQCKVDDFNNKEGTLNLQDGVDCPKCKNRGYWQRLNKNACIETYECTCMAERRAVRNSGGNTSAKKQTMSDYEAKEKWQVECKRLAKEFTKQRNGSWFFMGGQSGSGKTLLCSIIANELLFEQRKSVRFETWQDFAGEIKRDIMGGNINKVNNYLENIKKCDILFLDEVLKKYNDTGMRYLAEIINYRYANNKVTILTSEKEMKDLLEIDEATFGRIAEKCGKFLINIPKDKNKNYRTRGIV